MKKYLMLIAFSWLYAPFGQADVHCGHYILTPSNDGFMHINGVRPETQKFTFLRQKEDYDNVKFEWIVPTQQPGKWLGMEYIKRDGNKRFLNVQLLQTSMNAPRIIGTFDCVKVKK